MVAMDSYKSLYGIEKSNTYCEIFLNHVGDFIAYIRVAHVTSSKIEDGVGSLKI